MTISPSQITELELHTQISEVLLKQDFRGRGLEVCAESNTSYFLLSSNTLRHPVSLGFPPLTLFFPISRHFRVTF